MSRTENSTTSDAANSVPNWKHVPCVQYGFPEDAEQRPHRSAKLFSIFDPIPEDATTASPVYLLTQQEYRNQREMENPYAVDGYHMKATELQDRCEQQGRTRYPVYIESDKLRERGAKTLINWFHEFVEDWLDIPFDSCTFYFSGNRSIHVHAPRLVPDEQNRETLKQVAEKFCKETGAELDCGIYSRKRMFRLPGVEHNKTGLPKVECSTAWDRKTIVEKIQQVTPAVPESYASILHSVFDMDSLTVTESESEEHLEQDLLRILDSDKTTLELATSREIETPLIEQEQCPKDTTQIPYWTRYNAKEFSPYALAAEGDRSVAALRVKEGPFARHDKRDGDTMVPAWFYAAVGCSGEYTKQQEHAPLQLSKQDYDKWEYEPGDTLIIIGGRSRNSILISTSVLETRIVGEILSGEDGGRDAALEYLSQRGYDVGSTEAPNSAALSRGSNSKDASRIFPAREQPQTEAERLQRQSEQDGIETLSHNERIKVACRLLKHGWQPAWDWFKKQFGSSFKPKITHRQFQSIIEGYSDDYSHVEVPERP
jgi:hypothetical protein